MNTTTVILNWFQDPCEQYRFFFEHNQQSLVSLSNYNKAKVSGDAWIPDQARDDKGEE